MIDPWHDEVAAIRKELGRLLRDQPDAARRVADLLERLDRLESLYRDIRKESSTPAPSADDEGGRYRRRRKADGWYLSEARPNDGPAMLVSRRDYDTVARLLDGAEEPMRVEDLRVALGEAVHMPNPPDYRCRVVVRFWSSLDPPLIEKVGTRYRPAKRQGLLTQVAHAFDQLPER